MTDLNALLERVKAATAPDRELDAEIIKALGFHSWAGRMSYRDADGARTWDFGSSAITASVDAALALTERVLPSANCIGIELERGQWCGYVSRNGVKDGHWFNEAYSSTPALAILAATLSALIAKEATS